MSLTAGMRLGPYEIESRVGAGGIGEVYKARDFRLNRPVAIKILQAQKAEDPGQHRRFITEARAASALNHPNIITIYDVGREGTFDYIVMEYVTGKTMYELTPPRGMRVRTALEYAVQIAAALTATHAAGIIHRDLKPANVMVTDSGVVKVLDFGLAKLGALSSAGSDVTSSGAEAPRTVEGSITGTPDYMSPEQAEGKCVDERSDIFSLGVLIYEMLTGVSPFARGSVIGTLTAVLRDEPRPLRGELPEAPVEVERTVMRCLRKDPDERFLSMSDLKNELEELKNATESGSERRAVTTEFPRQSRSRRAIWWIAAAALLALAAGIWGIRFRRQPMPETQPPVPLTVLSGVQDFPSLSPNGKQVAFSSGEDIGRKWIYLKEVGTDGDALRITNGPDEDTQPMWSPDGGHIAFLRNSKEGQLLMVMGSLGGAERVVSQVYQPAATITGSRRSFGWSSDSNWLLYSSKEGLLAVSLKTGEHRVLIPNMSDHDEYMSPAVSPDGRTLAMVSRVGGSRAGVVLASFSQDMNISGKLRDVDSGLQYVSNLAWTPDGKELIVSAGPHGFTNLWQLNVAGGEAKQLAIAGVGDQPTLSREPSGPGARLVYRHEERDSNIWQVRMTGDRPAGKPAQLIASMRRDFEPRYSPDGKRIAFTSDRSGTVEVWVCGGDGSNATQMTHFRKGITSGGRWSPDGKQLAFLSTVNGQADIYMMDARVGSVVRLTDNPAHDTSPSWSRDGKWIYFGSNRSGSSQIWKMRPEANSTPIQVTVRGGQAAIESPDGKTLYYAMAQPNDGIWKVPAGGGEETRVLPTHGGWGNFDLTEKGIIYIPDEFSSPSIWFLPFAGGQSTRLFGLERPPDFGLSVSAVEGSILYSQIDRDANELALIEYFH
jgi:serine/threonine protein kinase